MASTSKGLEELVKFAEMLSERVFEGGELAAERGGGLIDAAALVGARR